MYISAKSRELFKDHPYPLIIGVLPLEYISLHPHSSVGQINLIWGTNAGILNRGNVAWFKVEIMEIQ